MTLCDVGLPLANEKQPRLHSGFCCLILTWFPQTRAKLLSVLQASRYRPWDNFGPTCYGFQKSFVQKEILSCKVQSLKGRKRRQFLLLSHNQLLWSCWFRDLVFLKSCIPLALTLFLQDSRSPTGKDWMETIECWVLQGLTLSVTSGYGSLYLFPSAEGGNFSDHDWTRHWSMSVTDYH